MANNSHDGKWYKWQIDKVIKDLAKMTDEEKASYILDMQQAIKYSERALRGEFPWYIHGRATQKEAREVALSDVHNVLNDHGERFV